MKRVVSPKRINEYAERFPTAEPSLRHWLKIVLAAEWKNSANVKASFNDVDRVTVKSSRSVYVFNIEHNRHRLIAAIHFNTQTLYVLRLLHHAEYARGQWKNEL